MPTISIDGADQVDMTWGPMQFELPTGTHHLRIDVRPGELAVPFKSIEHTVEIVPQRVHHLKYQAPPIPGFRPQLTDLESSQSESR